MAILNSYSGNNPQGLVDALIGSTVSGLIIDSTSISLTASDNSAVNFYDGSLAALGIGSGLLLTTGTTPGLTNTIGWFGQSNGGAVFNNGDPAIDAVVNSVFKTKSYDATTLEFKFTAVDPKATSITFDVVFGSEEYPEWVDQFVDCAVVLVNGVNYALFNHNVNNPLSVVTANLNAGYFQDNANGLLPIEYDGVSHVLKIIAPILPGQVNQIKIGIADTGDHIYDSGLFISNLCADTMPGSGIVVVQNVGTAANDVVTGSIQDEFINLKGGDDTAYSGGGDDIVVGGGGNDSIFGGTGNDVLEGDAGNDLLDGGEGVDTAVYACKHSQVSIVYSALTGEFTVSSANEGTDTLKGIEQIQFADGLYDLRSNASGSSYLLAHGAQTSVAMNQAGSLSLSGAAFVGHVLLAVVSDPDGIPVVNDMVYRWSTSVDGLNWTVSAQTGSAFSVGVDLAGSLVRLEVNYTDALGNQESLSVQETVAQPTGTAYIQMMAVGAPEGASVKNPLTTLIVDAMSMGYSANEAAMAVRSVLSLPDVALQSYDPYAQLLINPNDTTAIAVMQKALQVAIAASVADPTGFNVAYAVMAAATQSVTLDLSNHDTLVTLLQGVSATDVALVESLNKDLVDKKSLGLLETVWLDLCGKQDQMWNYHDQMAKLSVHINQAPSGTPTSPALEVIQNTTKLLSDSVLLAGISDLENNQLIVTSMWCAVGGSFVHEATSGWSFVPTTDYLGPVEFHYTITDSLGASLTVAQMLIVQNPQVLVDHPAMGTLAYSGQAQEGAVISASLLGAADPDGVIVSTVCKWQMQTGSGTIVDPFAWVDIPNMNVPTLAFASDQSDVGKLVRAVLVTTDVHLGMTVFEGPAQVVTNVNDAPTGGVSMYGTWTVHGVLTAGNSLADADGLGVITYQWLRDGQAIYGSNGSQYILSLADQGHAISVQASYLDACGTFESVSSASSVLSAVTHHVSESTTAITTVTAANVLLGLAPKFALSGADASLFKISTKGILTFAAVKDYEQPVDSNHDGVYQVSVTMTNAKTAYQITTDLTVGIEFTPILGTSGNDTIKGTAGCDTLDGLAGDDKLTGGTGLDTFMVSGGHDTILDFNALTKGATGAEILQVSAGAVADVMLKAAWVATPDSFNDGTANLITKGMSVDLSAMTQGQGWNVTNTGVATTITGSQLNDVLTGGSGNDILLGGAGNDVLVGGKGSDALTGGTGADTFRLSGDTKTDHITDFLSGTDLIELDHLLFKTLGTGQLAANQFAQGAAATTASQRIVYDSSSGNLWYDADGLGKGKALLIAVLDNHVQIVHSDLWLI